MLALISLRRWDFGLELGLVLDHDHLFSSYGSLGRQLDVFDADVRDFRF